MPNGTEFSKWENIFFPTVFRSEQERLRAFPEVETLCGEFLSNKNYILNILLIEYRKYNFY